MLRTIQTQVQQHLQLEPQMGQIQREFILRCCTGESTRSSESSGLSSVSHTENCDQVVYPIYCPSFSDQPNPSCWLWMSSHKCSSVRDKPPGRDSGALEEVCHVFGRLLIAQSDNALHLTD
jgi:hypothetical protein